MRLNNLNYLQNKTSRLEYHIRRTYRKSKNKITMFKNLEIYFALQASSVKYTYISRFLNIVILFLHFLYVRRM